MFFSALVFLMYWNDSITRILSGLEDEVQSKLKLLPWKRSALQIEGRRPMGYE